MIFDDVRRTLSKAKKNTHTNAQTYQFSCFNAMMHGIDVFSLNSMAISILCMDGLNGECLPPSVYSIGK